MNWWRRLFGGLTYQEAREARRDPDLDYLKRIAENHELRLQELDRDLDAISGGQRAPLVERRLYPRPPRPPHH